MRLHQFVAKVIKAFLKQSRRGAIPAGFVFASRRRSQDVIQQDSIGNSSDLFSGAL
jgi:hypothetical protein